MVNYPKKGSIVVFDGLQLGYVVLYRGNNSVEIKHDGKTVVVGLDRIITEITQTDDGKCRCWFCRGEMIWGGDFSFEDYQREGEGLIANLTCSECGAYAEFSTSEEEDYEGDTIPQPTAED